MERHVHQPVVAAASALIVSLMNLSVITGFVPMGFEIKTWTMCRKCWWVDGEHIPAYLF